jgi:ABC-type nitrate/sulfonate/bicarbonate transport system substrate-binding protein
MRVAEGAGYGTKSLLTHFLAYRAGLARDAYASVLTASAGREAAVRAGLGAGDVDIVTAQEPMMSMLENAGLVSTLYDLNSRAATVKVLGAPWPAHSLLVSPSYLRQNPATVQRLVNAFTCALRFINRSTPAEIVARLPASYRPEMPRADKVEWIAGLLPSFARGDFTISRSSVRLVADTIATYDFDESASGKWRATQITPPRLDQLYDNRFAMRAMRSVPAR